MALDPDAARYLEDLQQAGLPPVQEQTPDAARRNMEATAAGLFGPVDPVFSTEERLTDDGVRIRIYRPVETSEPAPALVYYHGGGWVIGSLDTHEGIVRALARRSGCVVVSVDYRLAPEHPFPAGLEDAWSTFTWVSSEAEQLHIDPDRLAVGGDSSGGNLAAVVARKARDAGIAPALQVLIYPVLDHRFDTSSYEEHADGYGLTRTSMQWYWQQYLGRRDGSDQDASPTRSTDLRGLPPTVMLIAAYDPLADEGRTYAERLGQAGVPISLLDYEGMIHGFVRMPAVIRKASEALDDLAAAVADALAVETVPGGEDERGAALAGDLD